MNWDDFKGNKSAVDYLKKLIETGSASHAYLFSGPQGVGKKLAAKLFAKALNCASGNEICNRCQTCTTIETGIYPLFVLEPQGKNILIEQIRQTIKSLSWKGDEKYRGVLLVGDIHRMNENTANAFLKTLEEPSGGLVIIGITDKEDNLLPTVRSRMQTVKFNLAGQADIRQILQENGASDAQMEILENVFPGSIGRPAAWLKSHHMFEMRESIIELVNKMMDEKAFDPVSEAENILKLGSKTTREIKEGFDRKINELTDFLGKKAYAKDAVKILEEQSKRGQARATQDYLSDVLMIFASFFRDCIIYVNSENGSAQDDYANIVNKAQSRMSVDSFTRDLSYLRELNDDLSYNLDGTLILENMFFTLRESLKCRKL